MALYGRAISESRKTGKVCDICGCLPQTRYHRHVDYGRTIGIEEHAQNRIKIAKCYADLANRPDLTDKRLCPDCAEELIFGPINK